MLSVIISKDIIILLHVDEIMSIGIVTVLAMGEIIFKLLLPFSP